MTTMPTLGLRRLPCGAALQPPLERALLDASGLEATDEAGVRVSGPQECADVYDAPLPGSFAERCDLCMGLVGELRGLWYEATQAAAMAKAEAEAAMQKAAEAA